MQLAHNNDLLHAFFFQTKPSRLNNTGKRKDTRHNVRRASRNVNRPRGRSQAFPGVATSRARSETTGRARFMPLRRYGDKHKSRRKTADTQRMYAAELGIRTRVNGRKCELIRSLRRTLPLSNSGLDAGRREESRRENRPFAAAHHLGSIPLERDDPIAIYLACEVPPAGEMSASSLSRESSDLNFI